MAKPKHASAYKVYCQKIVSQLSGGAAREHAYRPALQEFIESFGGKLRVTNEPGKREKGKRSDINNKPDFIVSVGQAPLGFIETKDIGEDLDEVGKTNQIDRYCAAYPNLILTDYLEFRRYVNGELRGKPIRIGKVLSKKGEISFAASGESELKQFFDEFLLEEVESISSPQELASRLATLTRQVRKLVQQELEVKEDSVRLHKLMVAFQRVLLADLDVAKFSDMFSQTLAYGFFAARVHFDGKGEFSRRTAASILPKTNPFLRRVFAEFANESLPDALIGAVDEIVDLLRKTNIKGVLNHFGERGREDPVVHFYESFLGAYDQKLKKAMGVFYTPDPVVSYMTKSIDELLMTKFGRKKGLADDKTLILDPALGTGSYLHKVIDLIHSKVRPASWDSYVSENLLHRIFGFEILMAPYAVAHLNLGIQLQKTGYQFEKEQRLGVYLTNTLEETAKRSEVLFSDWISEEADAAAKIKRDAPIMVVIGNPPYSAVSQNSGKWINDLMHGFDSISGQKCASYFEFDGQPLKEKCSHWINDDYVKFIRFAQWRIEQTGNGVLAFITNHGYLENPTFRGMRQALQAGFDEIYIVDLHGNSKKKEVCPDGTKDENVFNIQQGVSICFLVRDTIEKKVRDGKVFRADVWGNRDSKFDWLNKNSFETTEFEEIEVMKPLCLFSKQNKKQRKEYDAGYSVTDLFEAHSVGVLTAKDSLTIQNDREEMWKVVKDFSSISRREAEEKYTLGSGSDAWNAGAAATDLKNSGPKKEMVVPIAYRPFDTRFTYYTGKSGGFICRPRGEVMQHMVNGKNIALVTARSNKSQKPNHFYITDAISEAKTGEATTQSAHFPLYRFENGKRVSNLTKTGRELIKSLELKDPEMDFFSYMYAVFYSDSFRDKYKEFLRLEFPKLPVVAEKGLFKQLSSIGRDLIDLHLMKAPELDGGSCIFAVKGSNLVECVRYVAAERRVYINKHQYFESVSEEIWKFEVGGYPVLMKWLKDRKDRKINHTEIAHFERVVESISQTLKLVSKIEKVLSTYGGWSKVDLFGEAAKKAA